jgi:FtsH-binding integral membrane protein
MSVSKMFLIQEYLHHTHTFNSLNARGGLMNIGSSVWERKGQAHTMSKTGFIGAVSGFTVYGLALASIVAFNTMAWHPESIWVYLAIGLGIPIVGIIIALFSDNWFISLFGYTLVVLGLGAITGPTVAMYKTGVVMTALMATGGVTVIMSIIGIITPKSLESWGGYLFGGLMALVFVRFGQAVMASMGVSETIWYMPIIEYGAAVLFSMYIIYDWNRALRLPRTLDNAVDAALAIFLDVVNLFITLLRIIGGSGSSSSSKD